MIDSTIHFEQGPIRPPNEARSLLLRVTRNCTWNKCLFCPVYKNKKFSRRPVDEILQDIQNARDIADDIKKVSISQGYQGIVSDSVLRTIFANAKANDCYKSVALWLYSNTGACFLQDADNLVMKTEDLVKVLTFLLKTFPEIHRITTYARSKTVIQKTVDDLKKIKVAGLDRVHIGLESGYDPLLAFMKKGVSAEQHIQAGRNLIDAQLEVSVYVMPGLGGQEMGEHHARETARVINQIDPHFIRLRSLRVPARVPLYEHLLDGTFTPQTDDMTVDEIKLFLSTLDGITSTIKSDHSMNLLEEVSGKLPEDKQKMISAIEQYQNLSPSDRLVFRLGRRSGYYRSVDDFKLDEPLYEKISHCIKEVEKVEGMDAVEQLISQSADRYM